MRLVTSSHPIWKATLAVAGICTISACEDRAVTDPTLHVSPVTARALLEQPGRSARGLEDEFLQIETNVPGFGGYYLNEAGVIEAIIVDTLRASQARTAVSRTIAAHPGLRRRDGGPLDVMIRQGTYAFSQLVGWQQALLAAMRTGTDGGAFVSIDADEMRNRVHVIVQSDEGRTAVERIANNVGIPMHALLVDVRSGRVTANSNVTDRIRPIGAGLQIEHATSTQSQECTMGFVVTQGAAREFLTAGHCTFNLSGKTKRTAYQHLYSTTSNRVGFEASNPPWTIGGCPMGGYRCRLTDAALIAIDDTVSAQKRVAETQVWGSGNNTGNLVIQTWYPVRFSGSSLMGQTVYKTGQTTGTTYGPVTGTCVGVKYNVAFTSASLEVDCSWAAQMRGNSGDSGAPVYAVTWEGYGVATGIYFASYNPMPGELYTAYYNDWSMLEQEFGTLTAY